MYHRSSSSHTSYRKKSTFFPFLIVRLILSLILFSIFGFGIYRAIVYFSGVDPINIDPKNFIVEIMSSKSSAEVLSKILSLDPKQLIKGSQSGDSQNQDTPDESADQLSGTKILTFAVVADSHNNNQLLAKALTQAKEAGAKFVVGVGDYTDVGTSDELQAAKSTFDQSGLTYYLTAGDHDLWNSRDKGYEAEYFYKQTFGPPFKSFGDSNIRFIIVYNSDNYFGVDEFQMNWFTQELDRVKMDKPIQTFVFLHEPLYHPSSDHIMGKTNPKIAEQAQTMINKIKDARVGAVIAGDAHYYSQYVEPNSGIKMYVSGAITNERNAQTPRFLMVDVYDNGSYNITDTEVQ